MINNRMELKILSKSQNEAFARTVVAAFVSQLDPTVDELADIKTAVSEAVTNSIIHGYEEDENNIIHILCEIDGNNIEIHIKDYGKGIDDLDSAMQPLYTTRPDLERSGMGFTVMQTFMNDVIVISKDGKGTEVILKKTIKSDRA